MTDENVLEFDPNFPDRPLTRDFGMLSLAVRQNDSYADNGKSLVDILKDANFDADSLIYMAKQRAIRMIKATPTPEDKDHLVTAMASVWIDAFLAGLKVGDGRTLVAMEDSVKIIDGNRRQGNG